MLVEVGVDVVVDRVVGDIVAAVGVSGVVGVRDAVGVARPVGLGGTVVFVAVNCSIGLTVGLGGVVGLGVNDPDNVDNCASETLIVAAGTEELSVDNAVASGGTSVGGPADVVMGSPVIEATGVDASVVGAGSAGPGDSASSRSILVAGARVIVVAIVDSVAAVGGVTGVDVNTAGVGLSVTIRAQPTAMTVGNSIVTRQRR